MHIDELKFKQTKVLHLALKNLHIATYETTIVCPKTYVDGRKFIQEVSTKKNSEYGGFGESTSIFYFPNDKKTYKTHIELLESIDVNCDKSIKNR